MSTTCTVCTSGMEAIVSEAFRRTAVAFEPLRESADKDKLSALVRDAVNAEVTALPARLRTSQNRSYRMLTAEDVRAHVWHTT